MTTDRQRQINDVEAYFNRFSGRHIPVTEQNVDEMTEIMNREIRRRENQAEFDRRLSHYDWLEANGQLDEDMRKPEMRDTEVHF